LRISDGVRRAVLDRAGYRCEYCHIAGWELQVDHIVPVSERQRGPAGVLPPADVDDLANLAAACAHCNRFKGDHVAGPSLLFGGVHRLFHPRSDQWDAHFTWSADFRRVLPLDAIGDATIQRLQLNALAFRRQRELLRHDVDSGGAPWP